MWALRVISVLVLILPWTVRAAEPSHLTIETGDGRKLPFSVELAQSPEELSRGLMNRNSLAADSGMLFNFGGDKPVAMWMKNTLIPLDMIFITHDGKVAGIAQRTVPMSEAIIASPGPVRAVLEVNGGTAERLHIAAGDHISYPLFSH